MLMNLESLQAFVAFNFQATGLMLSVNKRGHKASPWGRPLLNLICHMSPLLALFSLLRIPSRTQSVYRFFYPFREPLKR